MYSNDVEIKENAFYLKHVKSELLTKVTRVPELLWVYYSEYYEGETYNHSEIELSFVDSLGEVRTLSKKEKDPVDVLTLESKVVDMVDKYIIALKGESDD